MFESYTAGPRRLSTIDDNDLENRFLLAAAASNVDELRECIKKGVNVNTFKEYETALHIAAERADIPITDELFKCPNINKNAESSHNYTPLHLACLTNTYSEYILYLLQHGVNPNVKDRFGKTPLQMCIERGNRLTAGYLLKYRAQINCHDTFGNTPLSIALLDLGDFEMTQMLLNNGADPNYDNGTNINLYFASILACESESRLKILLLLFQYNVDIHMVDSNTKKNALHFATLCAYKPLVKELLKRGVNLNHKDFSGKTPYDIAKCHHHYELMALYRSYLQKMDLEELLRENYSLSANLTVQKKNFIF